MKIENPPIVSVICTAYNQENYIKDALEGFVNQKTNFTFEIIVHDDASTDRTASIIRDYELKYPNLFVTIYQSENQYSKGNNDVGKIVFGLAKGKYIAICEGDDYWTDPYKLQKQSDFLEKNLNCSMVFHLANCINLNNEIIYIHGPKLNQEQGQFNIKDAILNASTLVPTNAMFFHSRYIKNIPSWFFEAPVGDIPLLLLFAHGGDLGFINEKMSTYRVMTPFSWSEQMQSNKKSRVKLFTESQKMWQSFNEWSDYNYKEILNKKYKKNKLDFMQNEFKIKFPFIYSLLKKIKTGNLHFQKDKLNG
ncbi:MAG: glycosyltransferase [Gelidibacter sp.]|nr:glycosyltransferase [Gelidibacter sp.]